MFGIVKIGSVIWDVGKALSLHGITSKILSWVNIIIMTKCNNVFILDSALGLESKT